MTASRRTLVRAASVLVAAGAAVIGLAGPASAHVTVNPSEATQGGYAALTFRVPNETDNTTTTKLQVQLPTDTPLASVSIKPLPGWTATPVKGKLPKPITTDDGQVTEAVTEITWTATSPASAIAPGQFQEFEISGGPMPDADKISFKALQTYSDGKVVRWIQEQTPGAEEPQYPAPTLTLTKAAAGSDTGAAPSAAAAPATITEKSSSNGVAIGLGIAGLILGLAGLAAGLVALRRTGAPAATAPAAGRPAEKASAGATKSGGDADA
jgi:uncharacterized protein YcnI